MKFNRRHMIVGAGALVASLPLGAAALRAQEKVKLRLSSVNSETD